MTPYIAYYRVSTDRQGRSGLGLEAQRSAVATFLAGIPDAQLLAEFTEIETGKKADRPELATALALCKKHKARLVIAKLDRLARNVYFVSGLMESGVDFVAVDMPYANRFTVHIMAAVAEHEREMISKRTKEALAAVKLRGKRLGNPHPAESLARGRAALAAEWATYRTKILPLIEPLQSQGLSYREMARELNRREVPTPQGKRWHHVTVARMLGNADERHP
jgi:DNA invertase Pin-like site-specific DNA recombinase